MQYDVKYNYYKVNPVIQSIRSASPLSSHTSSLIDQFLENLTSLPNAEEAKP
jgi:hypothetical protein